MYSEKKYLEELQMIQGKTIALVYIFEGEDAPGFKHYHIWKSDIISLWMNAIQSLKCMPLLLDVRTFSEKAINRTLPPIDFVINLNCGSYELSSMGLVPSICSFIGVPCIPCNTFSIVSGENKQLSNIVAESCGLLIPKILSQSSSTSIYRPLNFGSSFGIKRGANVINEHGGFFQEFINGYDITTPLCYNPLTENMEVLPTVIYQPKSGDSSCFFENNDNPFEAYNQKLSTHLSDVIVEKYVSLCNKLDINSYCRIDARIKADSLTELDTIINRGIALENVYFLEINPMPTIGFNNAYPTSFEALTNEHPLYKCVQMQKKLFGSVSTHSFLLTTSMIRFFRAKYKNKTDLSHTVK